MQIGGYRERPRVQISGKREISPNPCNNRLEETRSQFNLSIIIPSAGGKREAKNARKITATRSRDTKRECTVGTMNEGGF